MKTLKLSLAIALLTLNLTQVAQADTLFNSGGSVASASASPSGWVMTGGSMGVHQTFTLAQSSTVTSVSFAAKLQPPTDSLYVSVGRPGQAPIGWFYSSADTPGGAIDGVTVTSGAVFDQVQVPLAAPGNAGLRLTAGSYEIFWENYRSDMPYFLVTGDFVTASNPINAYGFADSSLAFSIQGVSAVPEVGAGWLMASGLGLLALLGARRRSGASC